MHAPLTGRLALAGILTAAAAAVALGTAGLAGARRASPNIFTVHPLVADAAGGATTVDPSLVNGWGLSAGPTTPWWTSNNGTGTSTLYGGTGAKVPLTVAVPGGPTGTVFNANAADFVVSQGGKSGAARFLFATEAGTILGWTPAVNGTAAVVGVDRAAQGASYKGLTTIGDRLYATDFHNARVDVFDASFAPVPGGFADPKIPKGWAPFGIQALAGDVFVTYAKQDQAAKDDVAGPGLGYVDEYTPAGVLVARVVSAGKPNTPPNAPWGLALAPASFAPFGGDLLVANFGNGRVSAYGRRGTRWVYRGQLREADGTPIAIDGLWAIAFGNDAAAGPASTLYFLAGPGQEAHGLLGSITAG